MTSRPDRSAIVSRTSCLVSFAVTAMTRYVSLETCVDKIPEGFQQTLGDRIRAINDEKALGSAEFREERYRVVHQGRTQAPESSWEDAGG